MSIERFVERHNEELNKQVDNQENLVSCICNRLRHGPVQGILPCFKNLHRRIVVFGLLLLFFTFINIWLLLRLFPREQNTQVPQTHSTMDVFQVNYPGSLSQGWIEVTQ